MRVVVVGGGFAGLTAALHLQERRHQVLLLERRGLLGGRATSFRDSVTGDDVDNGSHVLLGSDRETLDLLRRAGAADLVGRDLGIEDLWPQRLPGILRLAALRLHLLALGPAPRGSSLTQILARRGQGPRARRLLWEPLVTLLFNDAPERLAAHYLRDRLRASLWGPREASRLVLPRAGLAALHDRVAATLEARGGRVRRRARVEAIEVAEGRVTAVRVLWQATGREAVARGDRARPETLAVDAVVLAVPWTAVPSLLPEALRAAPPFADLARLGATPIVSVAAWVDRPPTARAVVGLPDPEVSWLIEKGARHGLPRQLGLVLGAGLRRERRGNANLAAAAEAALRRHLPSMQGARLVRSLVLREPEGVCALDAASEPLRPGPETPVRGLFLAGDWTATGLAATIESAVRSGARAARALLSGSGSGAPRG